MKFPKLNFNFSLSAKESKQNKGTGRSNPTKYVIEQQRRIAKKDIEDWTRARNTANNILKPRRYLLNNMYSDARLDAHLNGQLEWRKRRTLSSRFSVFNSKNKPDENLTWMLKQPAIYEIMSLLYDSIYYGHSLIQIDEVTPIQNFKGGIKSVSLVPRDHVVPEHGLLLEKPSDENGIDYRNFPDFQNWIIESEDKNLGLLLNTIPYVLYKRFAMAAWSEFADLFVSPMRIAKTDTRDTEMVDKLFDMLRNMGSLAYGVIDTNENIQIVETAKSNGEAFEKLMVFCNNELSKNINGAVIGEASSDGSRAKEEVGERIAAEITAQDLDYIENLMNHKVFPVLIAHGYPLEGCTFAFDDVVDINKLWTITKEGLPYMNVNVDWARETFGVQFESLKNDNIELSNDFFD